PNAPAESRIASLEAAGHPVFDLKASRGDLGGLFFAWEFATAIAGAVLGINPFDEPNVTDAKRRTQQLIKAFETAGALPIEPPLEVKPRWRERRSPPSLHRPFSGEDGRYVAILDYFPPDDGRHGVIADVRRRLAAEHGVATTYGAGPRYLHSTGQYHK